MTQAEWNTSQDPQEMLAYVHGRMTARKCRLLAAAFCRHVLPLTRDRCCQRAVEIAERFADGLSSLEEMLAVSEQVADVYVNLPNPAPVNDDPPISFKMESIAIQSTMFVTQDTDDYLSACWQCTYLATLRLASIRTDRAEHYSTLLQWQMSLIRDAVGNPYRPPTPEASWLTWNGGTIPKAAHAAYQERELPSGHLDNARLAVLADMLEEAGCRDAELLGHLREPQAAHVRGCWCVDLLLGKS